MSDFKLGKNATLELGLIVITFGYIFLSLTSFLYLAIGLIAIGNGLIRPNKMALVGSIYQRSPILKDEGFSLYYMGVNFGAFISIIIVGYIGTKLSYKIAFFIITLASIVSLVIYRKEKLNLLYLDNNQLPIVSKIKRANQNISFKWMFVFFLITILGSQIYWWGYEIVGASLHNFQKTVVESELFGFRIESSSLNTLNGILIFLMGIPIISYWTNRRIKNKNINPFYKFGIGAIFMCFSYTMLYFFTSVTNDSLGYLGFILILIFYALQVFSEISFAPVCLSFIYTLVGRKFKATAMGLILALQGFSIVSLFPNLISIYFDISYNEVEQINSEKWGMFTLYYLIFAVILLWLSSEYYDKLKKIIS